MSKEKYSLSAEERESMAKRIGAASPVDLAEAVSLFARCAPHMDEDSLRFVRKQIAERAQGLLRHSAIYHNWNAPPEAGGGS